MNMRGRSRRIGNDRAGKPIYAMWGPQGPSHHALEEASIGLDRMKSRLCCYFNLLLTRAADRQAGLFVSVLRRWVLHRAVGLCISTVWRHRRGVGLLPRQVSFEDLWILQWRQVHNKSADVSSVIDAWHTTTSTRLASPCKSLCVSYFRFELMHQVEKHRCSFFSFELLDCIWNDVYVPVPRWKSSRPLLGNWFSWSSTPLSVPRVKPW